MTTKGIELKPETAVGEIWVNNPVYRAIEGRHDRGEITRGDYIYQAFNAWQIWREATPATWAAFSAAYLAKPSAALLDEYVVLVEQQAAS